MPPHPLRAPGNGGRGGAGWRRTRTHLAHRPERWRSSASTGSPRSLLTTLLNPYPRNWLGKLLVRGQGEMVARHNVLLEDYQRLAQLAKEMGGGRRSIHRTSRC